MSVALRTADGQLVRVPLEAARTCRTIADALDCSSDSDTVPLPLVEAQALRSVLAAGRGSAEEIAERLSAPGPSLDIIELYCAASYLDAAHLLSAIRAHLVARIAEALQLRTPTGFQPWKMRVAALRLLFGIPTDLPPEEAP